MLLTAAICVSGCGPDNPALAPVGWWHDLQGGEIAATRPPPPGADLPYPRVFTVPPRPTLPSEGFKQTVQTELTQDRDSTELLAARTPIDFAALPPPPPRKPAAPPAAPPADTANATLPAAEAPPAAAKFAFAGAPPDETGLPAVPAAPPPPPDFEQVTARPAPVALPLPSSVSAAGADRVLFASGDASLNPSQAPTVRGAAQRRGKGLIAVEGHGEAAADTPEAQQTAIELGLRRAAAIATELAHQHVPEDKIVLSATAYGRDATLKVQ